MSAPKSVVKVNKNGVTYTSNVDAAKYYIHELSRAALRDVGKHVKKRWREAYYSHFERVWHFQTAETWFVKQISRKQYSADSRN